MQNAASKTRSLNVAFVIDEGSLRRLVTILDEVSNTFDYTVKFSDGTTVHYTDCEEIIKRPNSKDHAITAIAGEVGGPVQSAFISLKSYAPDSGSVEYTINGPQKNVIYFAERLDDWLMSVRQWYSVFLHPVVRVVLFLVAVVTPFYLWDHLAHYFFSKAVVDGKSETWIKLLAVIVLWVAEYFIPKLFPRGVFALGDGEKRQKFLIYLRRTAVGVVLTVILGLIVNWITGHS